MVKGTDLLFLFRFIFHASNLKKKITKNTKFPFLFSFLHSPSTAVGRFVLGRDPPATALRGRDPCGFLPSLRVGHDPVLWGSRPNCWKGGGGVLDPSDGGRDPRVWRGLSLKWRAIFGKKMIDLHRSVKEDETTKVQKKQKKPMRYSRVERSSKWRRIDIFLLHGIREFRYQPTDSVRYRFGNHVRHLFRIFFMSVWPDKIRSYYELMWQPKWTPSGWDKHGHYYFYLLKKTLKEGK